MLRSLLLLSLSLFTLVLSAPAGAVDEVFATEAGAIRGYDPVAYHLDGKPVPGAADITRDWNGVTWHFASVEHRELFERDPERYAPRYGGYCAYGTSQGYKVSTDPAAFAIVDGVLYLNYSAAVQQTWNQDRPGYITKAELNWAELEHGAYDRAH